MTPTQEFVIALISVLLPIIIPYAVTIFFEAKRERLMAIKVQTEQYKETIKQLCITAETIFKEGRGKEKFEYVLEKAEQYIKIPKDRLQALIETALLELKDTFKEEWDKLGKE